MASGAARVGSVASMSRDPRLKVIYHKKNAGVGGAVVTGYREALKMGCDIMIKIDADGQMDTAYIDELISPLRSNQADYTKGNRFRDFKALRAMPILRLLGNNALLFLVKATSGYWNIMDPTNGYTAIHRRTLLKLNLAKISKRYFFETDMLINLNIIGAVVQDIPVPARYGSETSSLSICRSLFSFPFKLFWGLTKRIFLRYFVYDFNMASVYLMISLPVFTASVTYGIFEWVDSIVTGIARPAGTIMLVSLPIILSFQMLLQAISIDISLVPRRTGND